MKRHTAGEDYLEAILILSRKMSEVRSVDVARQLDVSKPSVSHAVTLLKGCDYISLDDNLHISLTDLGRSIAEKVYERHCFFEKFLLSAGVDKDTAEQDACRMEHAVCDSSFKLLKEKYPMFLD